MSFQSFGTRSPFEKPEKPEYWKALLIATLPAFVASVMPPVVMHFLDANAAKKAEKKVARAVKIDPIPEKPPSKEKPE